VIPHPEMNYATFLKPYVERQVEMGIDDNDPNIDEKKAVANWQDATHLVVKTPIYEPVNKLDQVGVEVSSLKASASAADGTALSSSFVYDGTSEILTQTITIPSETPADTVNLVLYASDKVANDWTERFTVVSEILKFQRRGRTL